MWSLVQVHPLQQTFYSTESRDTETTRKLIACCMTVANYINVKKRIFLLLAGRKHDGQECRCHICLVSIEYCIQIRLSSMIIMNLILKQHRISIEMCTYKRELCDYALHRPLPKDAGDVAPTSASQLNSLPTHRLNNVRVRRIRWPRPRPAPWASRCHPLSRARIINEV